MTSSETAVCRPGFPWILTVLVVLMLAALVSLGVWQVKRLAWKEGLIAAADAAAGAAPAPVAEVLAGPAPEFRPVVMDCPGLATARFVQVQGIEDGQPGVRLVSACRPQGLDQTLLVDRGFVADEISARPAVAPSDAPVRITAVVRAAGKPGWMTPAPADGLFFARDNPAMARALGVGAVSPWTLYAVTSSNPEWAALKPGAPPPAFANNHLGYAMTWFGLAIVLAAFYVAMVRRRYVRTPS